MTATTCKIRFYDNDFSDNATITALSSVSGFPHTNASNSLRSRVWKPGGSFIIKTGVNTNLYINDGVDKTVALTAGTYTYSTLASHIQTRLNTSSSGWTCTYDFSGGTWKFTIARSSTGQLQFQHSLTSVWDTLGYTGNAAVSGNSWVSDEPRIHSVERYIWDLTLPMKPTFAAVIGPKSDIFSLSSTATVTLKANNLPDLWDSPDQSVALVVTEEGAFQHLDSLSDFDYRYFCLEIVDRMNPLGPEGLELGRIWLGDHSEITSSNVATGFSKESVDPSDVQTSVGGVRYYNRRTKYRQFKSLEIQQLEASERRELERVFESLGISTSFFVSLDPMLQNSETIDELTFYANWSDSPSLRHTFRDYYTVSFELREAV